MKPIFGILFVSAIALFVIELRPSSFRSPITSITKPKCTIKGNISWNKGNKVYHLPGMKDYESTVIDRTRGEKWFCTESEARASGWRKAPK